MNSTVPLEQFDNFRCLDIKSFGVVSEWCKLVCRMSEKSGPCEYTQSQRSPILGLGAPLQNLKCNINYQQYPRLVSRHLNLVDQLLNQLECNGYSSSTLAGYKCALRKVRSFMEENGLWEYSHDTGSIFLASCLTESGYSGRWNKYIKTSIQRFDDYIQGKPYTLK